MKRIKPTSNEHHWPRNEVKSIDCRKRDLIVRIADWTRDKDGRPSFDVECYIGGVYDWNESKSFEIGSMGHCWRNRDDAKAAAIKYAQAQIAKLL